MHKSICAYLNMIFYFNTSIVESHFIISIAVHSSYEVHCVCVCYNISFKMCIRKTKNHLKYLAFGKSKKCYNILQLYKDVIRYYLYVKYQLNPEITSKEPSDNLIGKL